MENEVKRLEEELKMLLDVKRNNDKILDDFLDDPRIREFFDLYNCNEGIKTAIEQKIKRYNIVKMETCCHAYVITEVVSLENGKDAKVYTCVKCGLTNEFDVKGVSDFVDSPKSLMGQIYKDTFLNSILIYDNVIDIPIEEISKIYDVIISKYPYISLYELRKSILNEINVIRSMILKK